MTQGPRAKGEKYVASDWREAMLGHVRQPVTIGKRLADDVSARQSPPRENPTPFQDPPEVTKWLGPPLARMHCLSQLRARDRGSPASWVLK